VNLVVTISRDRATRSGKVRNTKKLFAIQGFDIVIRFTVDVFNIGNSNAVYCFNLVSHLRMLDYVVGWVEVKSVCSHSPA